MLPAEELISLLQQKTPLVALVAPAFPIVYDPSTIAGKLRKMGFEFVLEVSAGAINTNKAVIKALTDNPEARFITSPCPSFVRLVRTKYPDLQKYLALSVDSPMIATARIAKEKYPNHKPVFIGPCLVKKLEASEDYPELNILAITFKEMEKVFETFGDRLSSDQVDNNVFDLEGKETRLYPISGGLAQSSQVKEILSADEVEVVSGWKNCQASLERFVTDKKVRLLDILFCEGGCINGQGINSNLTLEQRREKVMDYWQNGVV